MKQFAVDVATRQFSKKGEDICGDAVKITHTPDSTIIVMSDGLGSGVKANVLATLTVELVSGMMQGDLSLHDVVETLIATLPVCKWRNIAYSTFCIARVYDTGQVTIAAYDAPSIIHIPADARATRVSYATHEICGKAIGESYFRLKRGDQLLLYSDGIMYAGVGEGLALGWQEEGVLEFVQQNARRLNGDSRAQANAIASQALHYWLGKPGDDGTVLCARYREANLATVITGPPNSRADDPGMVKSFMEREGTKIVCGGTTSHMVATHLKHPLEMDATFLHTDLPPTASIEGVDLVTEGILTLSRASDYLKRGCPDGKTNAATVLLDELLRADGITFMVGTARNPAHQNTGLPDSLFLRRTVVEEISRQLRERGKEVELHYW